MGAGPYNMYRKEVQEQFKLQTAYDSGNVDHKEFANNDEVDVEGLLSEYETSMQKSYLWMWCWYNNKFLFFLTFKFENFEF